MIFNNHESASAWETLEDISLDREDIPDNIKMIKKEISCLKVELEICKLRMNYHIYISKNKI